MSNFILLEVVINCMLGPRPPASYPIYNHWCLQNTCNLAYTADSLFDFP